MTPFAELLQIGQGWALVAGLIFVRVGAIMALLPAFGEQMVPMRVRLMLTIAFTVILAPAVAETFPDSTKVEANLLRFLGIEVLAGLAVGIAFRLAIVSLQVAGAIAANVTSLSQVFGGVGADPMPAVGNVLFLGALALLAMTGLHEKVVGAMIFSYELFPPGRAIDAAALADWGGARVAQAFALAFTLSAPFVIASLLYNLALGAINRAMPQLMVAFVGAPAITMGGMILAAIAAPFLLALWAQAFDASISDLAGP